MLTLKESLKIGWHEADYKKTLSKEEKVAYKRLSRAEKDEAVLQFINSKNGVEEKQEEVKEERYEHLATQIQNIAETPSEPVEPEVYNFEEITDKFREVDLKDANRLYRIMTDEDWAEYEKERFADLTPGEVRFVKATQTINSYIADLEEELSEVQRKNPTIKVATNFNDVEPNYHNQKYFDAIYEVYEGVDTDNISQLEEIELQAKTAKYEYEILKNQPLKATPKKQPKAVKDSKMVEYVKSVEKSLNDGVIDKEYAKQAIMNYLEKEF